jgi:hypothetical protein
MGFALDVTFLVIALDVTLLVVIALDVTFLVVLALDVTFLVVLALDVTLLVVLALDVTLAAGVLRFRSFLRVDLLFLNSCWARLVGGCRFILRVVGPGDSCKGLCGLGQGRALGEGLDGHGRGSHGYRSPKGADENQEDEQEAKEHQELLHDVKR